MDRRHFLGVFIAVLILPLMNSRAKSGEDTGISTHTSDLNIVGHETKSEQQWRDSLTREQYRVLRREGTEQAFSSVLNEEKRAGTYVCAGCDQALFRSEVKFDSGTGWPSFFTTIDGAVSTKTDYKMFFPRQEYHCSSCGGHQGHVFDDGPQPSGQRWCNNGVALKFISA